MWMQYRTLIFRVELSSYIPFHTMYLHNLYKTTLWVASNTLHSGTFVLLLEVAVELVTMTVAFLYVLFIIYVEDT